MCSCFPRDHCYSFDQDVYSCPLLDKPHRLEALTAFNREFHLHDLLKTNPHLGYPTLEVRSYEHLDVRCEAPIPLGHDFHVNTYLADLRGMSDPSSPLAVEPSLEFSTASDTLEGSLIIHGSRLPLAPLGERRREIDLGLVLAQI